MTPPEILPPLHQGWSQAFPSSDLFPPGLPPTLDFFNPQPYSSLFFPPRLCQDALLAPPSSPILIDVFALELLSLLLPNLFFVVYSLTIRLIYSSPILWIHFFVQVTFRSPLHTSFQIVLLLRFRPLLFVQEIRAP